ncbi:hypothetical protein GCM10010271_41200 [Streptomyces kurssanovii]|nr:hypothetical protein GCM10010271_41200 [Streptomyces kurssanovii]
MPVEYLSAEQETRYGRFATEPSPGDLEQFFRLDKKALDLARRNAVRRQGWDGRCTGGRVRMLGTFLAEDPTAVPAAVVGFVAEQLGTDDEHFAEYGTRSQTARSVGGGSLLRRGVVGGTCRGCGGPMPLGPGRQAGQ